jgi:PPM family protein phosphatase
MFGRTEVGLVRFENEDAFALGDLDGDEPVATQEPASCTIAQRGPLLIVCDGMGGAAAGEIASSLAVDFVMQEMRESPPTADRAVYGRHLRRAVRAANLRVFEEGARNWKLKGMGTTLSAAGVVGKELVIAQVGDSRGYVLRGDTLVQVTRDQSIVSALLHAGRISAEEAETFAQSNVILQALGVQDDVDVALSVVELRRGDRLLLCSDGLHGSISDDALAAILREYPDQRDAVNALIQLTLDAGAPDNVTTIIADFSGDGLDEASGPEDLPRFVEFDPMEEGDKAVTTTSRVGRRLAARAGVGTDPGPSPIPATAQYTAIRDDGPATKTFARRSAIGRLGWLAAAVALVVIAAALILSGT